MINEEYFIKMVFTGKYAREYAIINGSLSLRVNIFIYRLQKH